MIDAPEAAPQLTPWRVERVLYDSAGLLVVDKPPGMPVHGGDESLAHSLVERLGAWLRGQGRSDYLGVHSRLDQGTSGVLLFTTSEQRNAELARAAEEHAIARVYRAIVRCSPGHRLKESGRIELLLEHDKDRGRVVTRGGKRAVTHYRVLEWVEERALVELELETGRTHQIRVSLAHLGAPICGDALYGGEPQARLFLHAHRLSGGPLPGPLESAVPESFGHLLHGVTEWSAAALREALLDAASRRAPLLGETAAFRVLNAEGDGVPGLVVDGYGGAVTLNVYDPALLARLPEIEGVLVELGYESVYSKQRVRKDLRGQDASELAPEGPRCGPAVPAELVLVENGLRFGVSLSDGLSTGLFVDQRDNRKRARQWARGGRMLNLFCYTSSFSVAAARAGAKTVSVDLSAKALARGRRNFELNGLELAGHSFLKDDAMKYLGRAVRRGERYDFIVLDPPSFATVGKGTFSVKARYVEAATHCLQLLEPEGRLLAVTNHTATSLSAFRRMLSEASERASRKCSLKDLPPGLDCPPGAHGPWPSKSVLVTVT